MIFLKIEILIEEAIDALKSNIDDTAIIACSGGIDSSVAAVLAHKAIGSMLHCVYVDTGFMRKDESNEVKEELGIDLIQDLDLKKYSGIIAAVAHKDFKSLPIRTTDNNVVYDLKGIFSKNRIDKRL